MPPRLKATARFFVFATLTLVLLPFQFLVLAIPGGKGRAGYVLPNLWHIIICRAFGIKVEILGTPYRRSQTVFVSNHISYLDIPAIGSVLPASFVAKKDVAGWPVFGMLAKLQQTGFIDRSRTAALTQNSAMGAMLDEGKTLIIFPEGTSTDGREVIPFKSSLFSLLVGDARPGLMIQPFTLSMRMADGSKPQTQDERDLYSWHRDMDTDLGVHLWRFAQSRGAIITLHFHPAFKAAGHTDRKELAAFCHNQVAQGLADQDNNELKIKTTTAKKGAAIHV